MNFNKTIIIKKSHNKVILINLFINKENNLNKLK